MRVTAGANRLGLSEGTSTSTSDNADNGEDGQDGGEDDEGEMTVAATLRARWRSANRDRL